MLQDILKMISDTNRLRIVNLLKDSRLCVGEIQTLLGMTQSNTSKHLDKLKSSGLIKNQKNAQMTIYYLNKEIIDKYQFLDVLLNKDIYKEKLFLEDLEKYSKYKSSDLNCRDLQAYNFNYDKLHL